MRRLGLARTAFEVSLVILVIVLALRRPSPGLLWRDSVVHGVPLKEKAVALTYDDGPHPLFTPRLRRVLDRYHVKATFFMIGNRIEQYPELVREVAARGHVIGNHTYTHPRDVEADTKTQIVGELDRCEQAIERITGTHANLFRPPRGLLDGTVFTIAEEHGFRTILWTVCADHHEAPTPALMAKRVLKHVRPGSIILAHDGRFPMRWKDVAATPLIIEALQKRGYRFVTVPKLLKIGSRIRAAAVPTTPYLLERLVALPQGGRNFCGTGTDCGCRRWSGPQSFAPSGAKPFVSGAPTASTFLLPITGRPEGV